MGLAETPPPRRRQPSRNRLQRPLAAHAKQPPGSERRGGLAFTQIG